MNNFLLKIVLSCLMFVIVVNSFSQNVETFHERFKEPKLKVSGGISANQTLYKMWGMENRKDPYSYYLNGNINFSILGINLPFTFSYSNDEPQYQLPYFQPFNKFGATPYYKWVKLYVGNVSMDISPSLLSLPFMGGGFELTPEGPFKIAAFYGRIYKATEPDTVQIPVFRRLAFGTRLEYTHKTGWAKLAILSAWDDSTSLKNYSDTMDIKPQDNFAYSLTFSQNFINKLNLTGEYTASALNSDIKAQDSDVEPNNLFRYTNFIHQNKVSASYSKKLKGALTYNGNGYNLGLGYERIDPNFATLGVPFATNDLENVTINAATALFRGKLQIGGNLGRQRNNLDSDKLSETKQTVGSVNFTFIPSQKMNLNFSYSNFSSFAQMYSVFDQINQTDLIHLDSLDYVQVNQTSNANFFYIIGNPKSERVLQNVNVNVSYQANTNQQGSQKAVIGNRNFNGNTAYSINFIQQKINATTSFNINYNTMDSIENITMGPSVMLGKKFFEDAMSTNFVFSWNMAYVNQQQTSNVLNFRIGANYTMFESHSFGLNLILLNRETYIEQKTSFWEFTGTLNYSYNFGNK